MLQTIAQPAGVFRGRNFMTPNVLRYYRKTFAGRTAYVELSEGEGMRREPIFGVTVRDAIGERFAPDPSALFGSLREAERYIRDLGASS